MKNAINFEDFKKQYLIWCSYSPLNIFDCISNLKAKNKNINPLGMQTKTLELIAFLLESKLFDISICDDNTFQKLDLPTADIVGEIKKIWNTAGLAWDDLFDDQKMHNIKFMLTPIGEKTAKDYLLCRVNLRRHILIEAQSNQLTIKSITMLISDKLKINDLNVDEIIYEVISCIKVLNGSGLIEIGIKENNIFRPWDYVCGEIYLKIAKEINSDTVYIRNTEIGYASLSKTSPEITFGYDLMSMI